MPLSFVNQYSLQVVLATPVTVPNLIAIAHIYKYPVSLCFPPGLQSLELLLVLSSDHLDLSSNPPYSIDKTFPTSCKSTVSMQSHLHSNIEEALYDYKDMPTDQQRKKMDQVLLMHTNGDPHAAEGLRLTFEALVSGRPLPRIMSCLGTSSPLRS